jgi:hypothetical protein
MTSDRKHMRHDNNADAMELSDYYIKSETKKNVERVFSGVSAWNSFWFGNNRDLRSSDVVIT